MSDQFQLNLGSLRSAMNLTLHTHHAARIWHGRPASDGKNGILGLTGFVNIMNKMKRGAEQDDPYSDMWIIRMEERQLNLQEALATETAGLADSYCALCTSLQVVPHSGVLAFIRLRLAELRPLEREGFADRDMFAFCDFMLRDGAAAKATFEHPHPEP